jgi:hypothetical protein
LKLNREARHMLNRYKSVPDVIKNEKAFAAVRKKAMEYDITSEFVEIFPELKTIVRAIKVDKEILFLHVENSVWRSELNFKRLTIVEKVNKHFGNEVIKNIKFV